MSDADSLPRPKMGGQFAEIFTLKVQVELKDLGDGHYAESFEIDPGQSLQPYYVERPVKLGRETDPDTLAALLARALRSFGGIEPKA